MRGKIQVDILSMEKIRLSRVRGLTKAEKKRDREATFAAEWVIVDFSQTEAGKRSPSAQISIDLCR